MCNNHFRAWGYIFLCLPPYNSNFRNFEIKPLVAKRLRAKFWPDCAIPDTSMKFGTVVDHD